MTTSTKTRRPKRRPEGEFENGKLLCPHCQNADTDSMFYCEWVVVQRRFELDDGSMVVDEEGDTIDESPKDKHIFCDSCCEEFSIPQNLSVIWD